MATAILNVTNGDSQAILDTVTYLLTNTKKKFHKFDPVIHIVTEASKEDNEILGNLDSAEFLINELKIRIRHYNNEANERSSGTGRRKADDSQVLLVLDALQSKVKEIKEQFRQHRATFAEQGWQSEHILCGFYREY